LTEGQKKKGTLSDKGQPCCGRGTENKSKMGKRKGQKKKKGGGSSEFSKKKTHRPRVGGKGQRKGSKGDLGAGNGGKSE